MIEAIEKLRESAVGGGMVTPFVLLSRRAEIDASSEATGNAEILDAARVLQGSVVRGHAKVLNLSQVGGSVIQGHARIGGSAVVDNSTIEGTADIRGDTFVSNSYIGGNALLTGRVSVYGSRLSGNIRVLDNAMLDRVSFHHDDSAQAIVEGEARLAFPTMLPLTPGTRIDSGLWTRPPYVIQASVFPVVEDVDDKVKIGCASHTIDFWLKYGRRVLTTYGLPDVLYDEYVGAVVMMREFKKKNPSPTGTKGKK